jgi:hypothetical protein
MVEHFQFNSILAISPQGEGSGLSANRKLKSQYVEALVELKS